MRRRFSRRRRGGNSNDGDSRPALDEAALLAKIREDGLAGPGELAPARPEDVPESYAVVGRGETAGGKPLIVGFAPDSAGDALFAALAAALAGGRRESVFPAA